MGHSRFTRSIYNRSTRFGMRVVSLSGTIMNSVVFFTLVARQPGRSPLQRAPQHAVSSPSVFQRKQGVVSVRCQCPITGSEHGLDCSLSTIFGRIGHYQSRVIGFCRRQRSLAFGEREIPQSDGISASGRKRILEKRWLEFFQDPSQWWDNRSEGGSARYPDFKHKKTHEALWCNSHWKPEWVERELAAMAPGTVPWNAFSWNRRLAGYVKAGHYQKSLQCFQEMQQGGLEPDRFSFVPVLNACASLRALQEGRCIHAQVIQSGCDSDVYVSNSLIDMYCKCRVIDDAWTVFKNMSLRNEVSWNIMILGYVRCGQELKALELYKKMQQEGVEPARVTFVAVLNACASLGELEQGRRIHMHIIPSGCQADPYVGSSLVDMYAKCGSIEEAWRVFNKMPSRNVVSWNALILGHVKCQQGQKAFQLFQQMQQEGVKADAVTFMALLNACASIGALKEGKGIHAHITQGDYDSDVRMGNSLINMYVKCGGIEEAWTVFNKLPKRDVVAWSAMILGHVKCGQGLKALDLFQQMQQVGVEPDPFTFVGLLNACASILALEEGRRVHEHIIQRGCEANGFVSSSLIDMYTKCGSIEDGWGVFNKMVTHDVVVWSAMILGYVKCGQGQKALELYHQMQQEGVEPDSVTFVGLVNACASIDTLEEGRFVHAQIIESGYESDIIVGNSLIDMYSKCGSIEDALEVFNKMAVRDVVSWNTMLGGYAMHGHAKEALGHFNWMCQEGVEINGITLVSLLSACSHSGLVGEGLQYFESMGSSHNIAPNVDHYACIVDLLGRAGHLHQAEDLIKMMPLERDVTGWVALLSACRIHGNLEMGEHITEHILPGNGASCVLLSKIYAATGKCICSANALLQRFEKDVTQQLGQILTNGSYREYLYAGDDQGYVKSNNHFCGATTVVWEDEIGSVLP